MPSQLHKIVIVGGGAGGLELATQLGNQLGQSGKAEIMLIDQSLTHLWKPLWHEVAAGTLDSNADELNYVVHAHRHYFKFLLGRMSGLNRQQKCIHLSAVVDKDGLELIPSRQIPYDTLIIAVGSVSNDFNTPGAVKHCFYMDSYEQLYDFRKHFLRYFMLMEHGKTSEQQMTIAIIGAGATGVELAAELRAAAQQAVQYGWSHINPQDRVKITLVEASATILAGLPTPLIHSVAAELSRRQITVITGQRVKEVTAAGLMTDSGTFIPAALKVWAAGIKAPAFLKDLDGLETNRLNQLVVKSTLQTTLDDSIFAFGDCASCPQPGQEKPVPPRAQAAHQQAGFLVKALILRLKNKPLPEFYYHDYGSLVSLSHYSAVGNLMGKLVSSFKLEGRLARLVYLLLYKSHQVKLFGWWQVCLMTLSDLLTWKVKPRLKLH